MPVDEGSTLGDGGMPEDVRTAIAAHRRLYEDFQRDAQARAPRALPGPSPRPAPALPAGAALSEEGIPGGWYWSTRFGPGEALRIYAADGPAAVALVCWASADPSERLNTADSVKVQWTTELRRGRVLFSDMGRVMLSIVEDSCGAHDVLAGGSTPDSVLAAGSGAPIRNTRDNLRLAASKHGLSRRDVPPCVSFFAPVSTDAQGRLVWDGGRRRAGDYVDLRAEMDLLVAVSNCPHPLDPEPLTTPPAVTVARFRAPAPTADDLCRTASAEVARAFENNQALSMSQRMSG